MTVAVRTSPRSAVRLAVRAVLGLALPTALYYALRAMGAGVYAALALSGVTSAAPGVVSLVRTRRVDGLSAYFTVMMLGALAVSLLPGSTRFLLAKESVLTGVTGAWFLASLRGARPLVYLLARPLLEGRLRWPSDWDRLWDASVRFRRMWAVASVLWGLGLLVDAALRVVLAVTMPPDAVPALGTALVLATTVLLNVITGIYYAMCGVYDPRSPLRRGRP